MCLSFSFIPEQCFYALSHLCQSATQSNCPLCLFLVCPKCTSGWKKKKCYSLHPKYRQCRHGDHHQPRQQTSCISIFPFWLKRPAPWGPRSITSRTKPNVWGGTKDFRPPALCFLSSHWAVDKRDLRTKVAMALCHAASGWPANFLKPLEHNIKTQICTRQNTTAWIVDTHTQFA